jgi:hypothetical protein
MCWLGSSARLRRVPVAAGRLQVFSHRTRPSGAMALRPHCPSYWPPTSHRPFPRMRRASKREGKGCWREGNSPKYLEDIIYGEDDGVVLNFADGGVEAVFGEAEALDMAGLAEKTSLKHFPSAGIQNEETGWRPIVVSSQVAPPTRRVR